MTTQSPRGNAASLPRIAAQSPSTSEAKGHHPAMKSPPGRDISPEPGTRPPEYVIETWVSKQLRDRIQRTGISLAEALQARDTQMRGTDRSPLPDMEAEP